MSNWEQFDGWCTARGVDASALPADRAVAAYLFALREHADETRRAAIEEALRPPLTYRVKGAPAWYGSDEDAWSEFARQATR